MFVETLHVYSTVGHRMRKEVGMVALFPDFFMATLLLPY